MMSVNERLLRLERLCLPLRDDMPTLNNSDTLILHDFLLPTVLDYPRAANLRVRHVERIPGFVFFNFLFAHVLEIRSK